MSTSSPTKFRPLRLYVDTETTGLDPLTHEIIEIAMVLEEVPEDPLAIGKIVDQWETKIRPLRIEDASPMALQVNGYTPEAWEGAPTFAEVSQKIAQWIRRAACIVGHNPKFDTAFLQAEFDRIGIEPGIPYHTIDTVGLAYVAWKWTGGGPALKLDRIRDFLGIEVAPSHSAMKDVMDCRRVLYEARGTMTGIHYSFDEGAPEVDPVGLSSGRLAYEAFIKTWGRPDARTWDELRRESQTMWVALAAKCSFQTGPEA